MRRSRSNEAGLIEIPLTIGAVGIVLLPVWAAISVVEELYFRGYLMPRMTSLGVWAPVVSVFIWACTHIGQPWDIPGFIPMFIPIAYFSWWKKNIYVIKSIHGLGNLMAMVMTAAQVFGSL